ncbi:hypothetical protein H6P81_010021 [Aristolochia fimbriata]|uniref:Uncharacterized protein n=1 Tax=Aristolochia fimbriata TaxID=158543 RepID=A0AAV7EQE5_ARIFI|nr:hypothetical protein H6P81_010021 [Aristolochia fimbriata]
MPERGRNLRKHTTGRTNPLPSAVKEERAKESLRITISTERFRFLQFRFEVAKRGGGVGRGVGRGLQGSLGEPGGGGARALMGPGNEVPMDPEGPGMDPGSGKDPWSRNMNGNRWGNIS